jgi:hypothetical protein
MSKPIKELIKEAQAIGVNLHDYVAQEVYGTVNMETRRRAKELTFGVLYGSTANVAKKVDRGGPWKMTKEQTEVHNKAMSLEFKQEHMNEPFEQYNDCPVVDMPQPEDRMHRVGVVPFKVEVLDDNGGDSTSYTIHAASALDARCMAFVLDDGCPLGLKHWDDEQIDLALACTEVIG